MEVYFAVIHLKTSKEHNRIIFIYDKKLLLECIERDNALLEGEYDKLNAEVVITYTCYFRILHYIFKPIFF